jgi:hypothetical protein
MKQQIVPPGLPGDNPNNQAREAWSSWFTWVTSGVNSLVSSGPSAERPVKQLWIGRQYFDTDLGIPVWYDGTDWVDATGIAV